MKKYVFKTEAKDVPMAMLDSYSSLFDWKGNGYNG